MRPLTISLFAVWYVLLLGLHPTLHTGVEAKKVTIHQSNTSFLARQLITYFDNITNIEAQAASAKDFCLQLQMNRVLQNCIPRILRTLNPCTDIQFSDSNEFSKDILIKYVEVLYAVWFAYSDDKKRLYTGLSDVTPEEIREFIAKDSERANFFVLKAFIATVNVVNNPNVLHPPSLKHLHRLIKKERQVREALRNTQKKAESQVDSKPAVDLVEASKEPSTLPETIHTDVPSVPSASVDEVAVHAAEHGYTVDPGRSDAGDELTSVVVECPQPVAETPAHGVINAKDEEETEAHHRAERTATPPPSPSPFVVGEHQSQGGEWTARASGDMAQNGEDTLATPHRANVVAATKKLDETVRNISVPAPNVGNKALSKSTPANGKTGGAKRTLLLPVVCGVIFSFLFIVVLVLAATKWVRVRKTRSRSLAYAFANLDQNDIDLAETLYPCDSNLSFHDVSRNPTVIGRVCSLLPELHDPCNGDFEMCRSADHVKPKYSSFEDLDADCDALA